MSHGLSAPSGTPLLSFIRSEFFPKESHAPGPLSAVEKPATPSPDASSRAELEALRSESDPDLLYQGLFSLAAKEEAVGRLATAVRSYEALTRLPVNEEREGIRSVQERARSRLEVLEGRAQGAERAETLLRDLVRQGFDIAALGPMFAAGALFQISRLALLSRLLSTPIPGLLTRGGGAAAVAAISAFALEGATLGLTARVADRTFGHGVVDSSQTLGQGLLSSYILIGGAKLASWVTAGAYRAFASSLPANRNAFFAGMFEHVGALAGLRLGHGLESLLGLRPGQAGTVAMTDSIAALLQLHVAGQFGKFLPGLGMRRREESMALDSGNLSPRFAFFPGRFVRPAALPTEDIPVSYIDFMSSGGREGGSPSSKPPLRRPQTIEGETPKSSSADPREPILAPRVTRAIVSGNSTWDYELVLGRLENFLAPGAEGVIAVRNGAEIRLRLIGSGPTSECNDFMKAGIPGYQYEIREGSKRGSLSVYLDKDRLILFSLRTQGEGSSEATMLPGAGTIVMDWLATQAASRRQNFHIIGINQVQIFDILRNRPILDHSKARVEAARFTNPVGHRVVGLGRLRDGDFTYRHGGRGFFNVFGLPHPTLLPQTLRSAKAKREGSHSYEVQIDPLREFLLEGHKGVLARQDGLELRATVLKSRLAGDGNRFMPPQTPLLELGLGEGQQRGILQLYLEPNRMTLANIITNETPYNLPPGAGSLVLDWSFTQAAVHGMEVSLLNVINPQIVRIISRRQLFEPETVKVESGTWDYIYGTFDSLGPMPYDPDGMLRHFASGNHFSQRILQIQGRPNRDLVPPALRQITPAQHPWRS